MLNLECLFVQFQVWLANSEVEQTSYAMSTEIKIHDIYENYFDISHSLSKQGKSL